MPRELFGVEIEVEFDQGGSYRSVAEALRREGLSVQEQWDTHLGSSHNKWTVKRDGSLNGGAEIVSPPLDFNDPQQRDQVDRVARALQSAHCRPAPTAGIHVHVEAQDLNAVQLAAVCRFFWKFEDVLYRIASSGWKSIRPAAVYTGERYARPLPENMMRAMVKVRDDYHLRKAWATNDENTLENWMLPDDAWSRYHAVNLQSWWMRGTVEFRLFNSSLNPDRIQAYIALCVAIIRDARRVTEKYGRYTKKNYPLGTMAADTSRRKKAWNVHPAFERFYQVMRTTTGDTKSKRGIGLEPLMSKEDWKRVLMCWKDSQNQLSLEQWRQAQQASMQNARTFVIEHTDTNFTIGDVRYFELQHNGPRNL